MKAATQGEVLEKDFLPIEKSLENYFKNVFEKCSVIEIDMPLHAIKAHALLSCSLEYLSNALEKMGYKPMPKKRGSYPVISPNKIVSLPFIGTYYHFHINDLQKN